MNIGSFIAILLSVKEHLISEWQKRIKLKALIGMPMKY